MGLPQELRLGDKERSGCHDPKDKKEAPHLLARRLGGWSRPVKPFKGFLLREPRVEFRVALSLLGLSLRGMGRVLFPEGCGSRPPRGL